MDRIIRSSIFSESTSRRERERQLVRLLNIALNDNNKSYDYLKVKENKECATCPKSIKKAELEVLVF